MQGEIYNVKNTNDIIAAVYKAAYARADQTQGVYTESIIARNGTVGTVGKNMQQDVARNARRMRKAARQNRRRGTIAQCTSQPEGERHTLSAHLGKDCVTNLIQSSAV